MFSYDFLFCAKSTNSVNNNTFNTANNSIKDLDFILTQTLPRYTCSKKCL